MTSRRELAIPTSRVAAGGATTVGEDLLAFSFQEATELLENAPAGLGEAEIGELHQRTEGWVAGLLLATRSGLGSGLPPQVATAGPHFDYLADEVLAGLPADLQRFLLETAVLERFTPALAAAVSDRPDAPDVIRDLVASHLFIVQAQGDWFRYHHLFHAFLRRRLVEREPDRLAVLHERAARAWEAAGDHQEAVRHHLEAGAPDAAAAALEEVAESMVPTPERQTLAGWLERIPPAVWRTRPADRARPRAPDLPRRRPRCGIRGLGRRHRAAGGGGGGRPGRRGPLPLPARDADGGGEPGAAGGRRRSPPGRRRRRRAGGRPGADDRGRRPRRRLPPRRGRGADGRGAGDGRPPRARAPGALRRDGAGLLLRLPRGPARPGRRPHRRRPRADRADRGRGVVHDAGLRPRQPGADARRHRPLPRLPRRRPRRCSRCRPRSACRPRRGC